jgi:hypothetical protein
MTSLSLIDPQAPANGSLMFPLPMHHGRWLLDNKHDFKLPYDISLQAKLDLLPPRPRRPEPYETIKRSMYGCLCDRLSNFSRYFLPSASSM